MTGAPLHTLSTGRGTGPGRGSIGSTERSPGMRTLELLVTPVALPLMVPEVEAGVAGLGEEAEEVVHLLQVLGLNSKVSTLAPRVSKRHGLKTSFLNPPS